MIEFQQPDNGIWDRDEYVNWYGSPGNIAWKPWILESQAISEDDTTLQAILLRLKRTGITPKLSIRSSARLDEDRPYGIQEYMRPWTHDDNDEMSEYTLRYKHELCDLVGYRLAIAVAQSEFPLESLILEDICQPTLSDQQVGDDVLRYSKSFLGALSRMNGLASISLLFSKDPSSGHDPEPLSDIVKALETLPISHLSLRHVSGSTETFVTLLSQHESTLREICFEDTGVVDEGYFWEEPFQQINSMTNLQRVSLSNLSKTADETTVSVLRDKFGLYSRVFNNQPTTTFGRGLIGCLCKEPSD
jgi:hypothetical protein